MHPPYPGSCLCGSVKYQRIADPLTFYVCHCTMCQRRTGGAALPVMWVRRTDLEILEGHAPLAEFDLGNG
ncbi:GFA family protein, partial [Acinetobacter baumannii]